MRVLVTGAGGQVGWELAHRRSADFEPVGVDRDALDITDRHAIRASLASVAPALVVNCAAYTSVDRAEDEPAAAYRCNAEAVGELALACRARGIGLVHLSTDYVFDGSKSGAYLESDTANPLGVYGASKLAGEALLRARLDRHVILRASWVFGRRGRSFVDTMLRLGREREEVAVVDDQIGAPCPAASIAAAVRAICGVVGSREDAWGTYHFSATPALSWCAFARRIFALGVDCGLLETAPEVRPIGTDEWPARAERPRNSRLDASLLQAVFDIPPAPWAPPLREYIGALGASG